MRIWPALFACFALACSSESKNDVASPQADVGTDGASADGASADGASAACGVEVGDTLCDLDLQGYERNAVDGLASSAMATTFKTSQALTIGTQRYAFIFNTAYW